MSKILISIITPNYNGKKFLGPFLDSIRKLNFPKNRIETILVDNNSEDGSVEFTKKKYPWARLIKMDKNTGYAEGCNVGVRNAKGKYIALTNVDITFDKNWAKELFRFIENNKKIALVGAKILNKNEKGKYEIKGYNAPTLMHFNILLKDINKNTIEPFEVFGSVSPFYRKNIIHVPFDPDYFAYAEDTYFSWLVMLMGYKTRIVPKAIAYHEGSGTIKEMKENDFFVFLGERNRLINLLIFFEFKTIIKLLPILFITLVIYNLFDIINLFPRLKSYFWLIFNFKLILKKRRFVQSKRKINDAKIIRLMSSSLFEESLINNFVMRNIIKLLNKFGCLYCKILNLKTLEFYRTQN